MKFIDKKKKKVYHGEKGKRGTAMINLQKIKAEETEEVLGALAACFDYQERREEKDFRRIPLRRPDRAGMKKY